MIRLSFIIGLRSSFQEYSTLAQHCQGRCPKCPMKLSLVGVRKHHHPLIMDPEVPPHIIHHHRPRKMKRKPSLSCLINADSRSAYGVAAAWLHRINEPQDLSLYGVCKAEQVCSPLWNSLSWCEQVTLSVGFARHSSPKKKICTLESLLMGDQRE